MSVRARVWSANYAARATAAPPRTTHAHASLLNTAPTTACDAVDATTTATTTPTPVRACAMHTRIEVCAVVGRGPVHLRMPDGA